MWEDFNHVNLESMTSMHCLYYVFTKKALQNSKDKDNACPSFASQQETCAIQITGAVRNQPLKQQ
jgi:hypothetical protein